MKAISLSILFVSLSLNVFADRGDEHYQEMCKSESATSLTANGGTCNVVMSASSNYPKGACSGALLGSIPCTVYYDTTPGDAVVGMKVVCGEIAKPILNQQLDISASVYKVSALIRTAEGKSVVQSSPSTYAIIQSGLVNMLVTAHPDGSKTGAISFILNETENPVLGVVCE